MQGGWAQVQQHEQDRVQQEQGLQGDEGQGQQDHEASTRLEGLAGPGGQEARLAVRGQAYSQD